MGTVVGSWRLRVILLLVIFATAIYTLNAMFGSLGGSIDSSGYYNYSINETNINYNNSSFAQENSDSFIDIMFGIGDFFTFATIDNLFARLLINIVMSIVFITIGYIIYTFIKEWIPFV